MKVPFSDLYASNSKIEDDALRRMRELIRSSDFIGGEEITHFESEFADYAGTRFCAGCASGTSALTVALMSMDIGRGDVVLTVPNTFIATAEAISLCGAEVDFIDIENDCYCMDPDALLRYMDSAKGKRVKAIIPVHLYGQMADIERIKPIADRYHLRIIEDAAHAHGASLSGMPPASLGDCAAYSFFPGKNLGAFGDAGAIVTNNEELFKRAKMITDHGRMNGRSIHEVPGTNARLDSIQAAVLRLKLRRMKEWNRMRIENANLYFELLRANKKITLPKVRDGAFHVYHIFAVKVADREHVIQQLNKKDITAGVHYPVPIHLQPSFRHLDLREGSFPVSEQFCRETLSLPLWPQMEKEKIEYVADSMNEICR